MPIDTRTETIISFNDARSEFKDGRRKALATLHRWRLKGCRGVKLETLLIGGIRYTSKEAIDRFIQAQNADESPAPAISPAQRRRQAEAAQAQLERMGVR